jgi:hypothetical protein
MKHKHYDVIVAFANGEEIEYYSPSRKEWSFISRPGFDENICYRVKPKDTTTYLVPDFTNNNRWKETLYKPEHIPCIELVRSGSTTKIKSAEVING